MLKILYSPNLRRPQRHGSPRSLWACPIILPPNLRRPQRHGPPRRPRRPKIKQKLYPLAVFFALLFFCCSCRHSKAPPKDGKNQKAVRSAPVQMKEKTSSVRVKKVWIRESFKKDFTRPSLLQTLRPALTSSGLLIQGNKTDGISAYTLDKGKRKWFFPVKGGAAGEPSIKEDFVFFGGADGFVYALYLNTGKVLWKQSIKSIRLSAPEIKGDDLYFAGPDKLYRLKRKTGESVWTYTASLKSSDFTVEGIARPLAVRLKRGGLMIYFKTGDGSLLALNRNGKLKWKRELTQSGDRFTSALYRPVMGKTCLYSPGLGGLYCLNPKTGNTVWQSSTGAQGEVLLSGSLLFYAGTDGKIRALDQKSGKQIWSHKAPAPPVTSPRLYKDMLIYGEYSGALRFISARTGKSLGAFFFGGGMSAPPALSASDSSLYFISNTGWLYKLYIETI